MGQYTPAVVVHDLAPPKSEWPEWIRPLSRSSNQDHERFVICSTHPRELGSHVDPGLWLRARRLVLDDVSTQKLSRVSGVGGKAVRLIIGALRMERDVYTRRRAAR